MSFPINDRTRMASELHQAYCAAVGYEVALTLQRIFAWEAWKARGWTKDDLLLVISHLKSKIRAGRKWDSCLRFYQLICRLEDFEEELCAARALARKPKMDAGKAQVLRATHRPDEPPAKAPRTAAQIIAADLELRKLLDLRDSL
jgi:hypothetical protein